MKGGYRIGPAIGLILVSFGVLQACSERLGPPDHTYRARGVLQYLPPDPNAEILIQHEAIEDFVDRDGKKVGMPAMTMAFAPAAGLRKTQRFARGDRVQFRFEVRWKETPTLRVIAMRKLPKAADSKGAP